MVHVCTSAASLLLLAPYAPRHVPPRLQMRQPLPETISKETVYAHLLLIVLDASDPEAPRQFETVTRVLDEIGATTQPRLLVLNKVDRLRESVRSGRTPTGVLEAWQESNPGAIVASARDGEGIEMLASRVLDHLRGEMKSVCVRLLWKAWY